MIELGAGNYELSIEPDRGGSVARFEWNGVPLFRPSFGASIVQTACFPLVPFSNRIEDGKLGTISDIGQLAPNVPEEDARNPIHGYGWISAWTTVSSHENSAIIEHIHHAGPWPWRYTARQHFSISTDGLLIEIQVTNDDDRPMPAGIGLHPYFPIDGSTKLRGLHHGKCQNNANAIPFAVTKYGKPVDWWQNANVPSLEVDAAYYGRVGPLVIDWPNRDLRLSIEPDMALSETIVYVPVGENFFCVEPISHLTNAINRPELGGSMTVLRPGGTLKACVAFRASRLAD